LVATKNRGLNPALSDITHDNNMLYRTRGAQSTLSLSAVVCACPCPVLSTKGCDEIYSDKVPTNSLLRYVSPIPKYAEGITRAKNVLNNLHSSLASRGFTELFVTVDGLSGTISIVRSHPRTHRAYVFIIRPTFSPSDYPPLNKLDGENPGILFFMLFIIYNHFFFSYRF
jgi:hypothetical protein